MSNTPDWVWAVTPDNEVSTHGTYQIDGFDEGVEIHSGPIPYQLPPEPGPGTFYLDDALLPMASRLARLGTKGVLQQVDNGGNVTATVKLKPVLGWFTRRWIRNHPLQLTVQMFRPEWGEWRQVIGRVEVA